LEASGFSRPDSQYFSYPAAGAEADPDILRGEGQSFAHYPSGTKVYNELGKTVFANWVYVSPGEQAKITYKYILPFRLNFDSLHHPADSFSTLFQKQSGSMGSKLISEIKLPENMKTIWHWPENTTLDRSAVRLDTTLNTDRFMGIAVEK